MNAVDPIVEGTACKCTDGGHVGTRLACHAVLGMYAVEHNLVCCSLDPIGTVPPKLEKPCDTRFLISKCFSQLPQSILDTTIVCLHIYK